jgi:hypothetical protein
MYINGNLVSVKGTTVSAAASAINAATLRGVTARVNGYRTNLRFFTTSSTIVYSNVAGNVRGTIDTATSSPTTLQIIKDSNRCNVDCVANLGILNANVGCNY